MVPIHFLYEAARNVSYVASAGAVQSGVRIIWREENAFKAKVLQLRAKTQWQNEVAVFSFFLLFVSQTVSAI